MKTKESSQDAVKWPSDLNARLNILLNMVDVGIVEKRKSRAKQVPRPDPGLLTTQKLTKESNQLSHQQMMPVAIQQQRRSKLAVSCPADPASEAKILTIPAPILECLDRLRLLNICR